jgi:hypothetical protein
MENQEPEITPNTNKQPQPFQGWGFFRFLAITSFIGSGAGAFVFLFVAALFNFFDENMLKQFDQQQIELTRQMLSAGRTFFVITGLLYSTSFVGVLMMWSKKKAGLHLYSISQLCILIVPMLFIKNIPVSFLNVMLTAAYIWGYASYSRYFESK